MIPSHQQHSFVYLNEWLWRREAITVAITALSFPTFDPLAELDYWSGSSATIHKRTGVLSLIWKSLPLQEECRDALSCSFSINNPWKSTMLPRDQMVELFSPSPAYPIPRVHPSHIPWPWSCSLPWLHQRDPLYQNQLPKGQKATGGASRIVAWRRMAFPQREVRRSQGLACPVVKYPSGCVWSGRTAANCMLV